MLAINCILYLAIKRIYREPRVAEAQHFATTLYQNLLRVQWALLVVSHKTRIYIGCVLNAVSMEAKKYGCWESFVSLVFANRDFGKSSNNDSG